MDLRHLRYFVAVAEEGHFGRAAQRLHIVQPALSMQIRSLEDEIGGALFARTSRKVGLTQAGELLLVEARRTLAQAERTKDIVQRSMRGEIGSVRVGFAGNAVFTGKLTDDLRAFHRTYPDAQLELCEMAPHLQPDAILSGHLDLGYCPNLNFAFDPQLRTENIGTWPMVVAMASDHPFAARKRIAVTSLAAEPLILYAADADDEGPLEMLRMQISTEPKVAYRVSNSLSVLALVAAGLGLALVPESLTGIAVPNLVYRKLADNKLVTNLTLISRLDETGGSTLAFLKLVRGE
jgi:DNA-binding transcriptional LysR family regulator